jgi:hypothetical protein
MTQHALKWFIFAMLVLTVPVIFFLFTWVGFLPVAGIIAISVTGGEFDLAIMGLLHVALFGGFFYWISVFISRMCAGACERARIGVATIIGIALGVITLQPWYRNGEHFHSLYYLLLHG